MRLRDSGATIGNRDGARGAVTTNADLDVRAISRKAHRVRDEVIEHLGQRIPIPSRAAASAVCLDLDRHIPNPRPQRYFRDAADELDQIDRTRDAVLEVTVDARELADARDQPLEPFDVAKHQRQEARTLRGIVTAVDGFRSRADPGERILELVGHVRGKTFHERDVIAQPLGQLFERTGQFPNLVAPTRAREDRRQGASPR